MGAFQGRIQKAIIIKFFIGNYMGVGGGLDEVQPIPVVRVVDEYGHDRNQKGWKI